MTIAILGAGDIGGACARQLAAADLVARITLIDDSASVAAGKALDIAQAAAVDGYRTRLSGTGDITEALRAAIIVIADRAGGNGEWQGEPALALLARLANLNRQAPILCAGANAGALIDRGVHEIGLPASRLFGTAPEALRGAAVSLVALESGAAPADISLLVVGRAPTDIVIAWDGGSIAGQRITDVIPPPAITRVEQRLSRLWPPAPYALASAVTQVTQSMTTRGARTHVLQISQARGDAGAGRSAMLPARVHMTGIASVQRPTLPARDRVRLETALQG
ncbi:MAG: hypothetical protein IT178_08905 [Acidobacteria bacterium]|nr:hypothetical protein [Acidobacteriota bacterium]